MGGMPSTNAPGYAPQQSPAPAAGGKMPVSQSQYGPPSGTPAYNAGDTFQSGKTAQQHQSQMSQIENEMKNRRQGGGKMPASQSQYGPPQQGAGRAGSVGQQRMADAIHRMLPADGRGAFVGQERMADAVRGMIPASSQPQQQGMDVAPQASNGQQIPQDVLSRYNQFNQPSQGPGGYGTQQQAPFQTQQMLNNVQQGAGALGQMGQQVPQQAQQQLYTGTGQPLSPPTDLQRAARQQYFDQDADSQMKAFQASQQAQQAQTGYQAPSSNMSQLYGQFNQAQAMGQGQQQQNYGSQSAGQPSGGFMSGTGGGTTGGGGMSRGKGFRSGGAVNNIRLSNDDVRRILNALATAREVVKNGK